MSEEEYDKLEKEYEKLVEDWWDRIEKARVAVEEARKNLDKLPLEMSSASKKYGKELKLDVMGLAESRGKLGVIYDLLEFTQQLFPKIR